jgi:hypothetical protein
VSFSFGGSLASKLVFGTVRPALYLGLLGERVLPGWAVIYSFSIWWLIWSPTEEMTYNGYALPRLQALTGRKWIAVALVGFWWHSSTVFFLSCQIGNMSCGVFCSSFPAW